MEREFAPEMRFQDDLLRKAYYHHSVDDMWYRILVSYKGFTVNSRLAHTPLLRTLAVPDTKRRPEGVRYNESWLYIQHITESK